ncbi:MAG: hypothetical protein WC962_08670 [Phycisphaerae bacterium]
MNTNLRYPSFLLIVLMLSLFCADILAAGEIEFTSVPAYGARRARLEGRVRGVNYTQYRVAVFVYANGWLTKPKLNRPKVRINRKGFWKCDIDTGSTAATEIIAFLVPRAYSIPVENGTDSTLTEELFDYPYTRINTDPTLREISFAGYDWWVLDSDGLLIDDNYYSDTSSQVYVEDDKLNLNIIGDECSEVACYDSLGYGKYIYTLQSDINALDPNAVLDMFTWEDDVEQFNNRRMDIEFSRWSDPNNDLGHYYVQPWDSNGNMYEFDVNSAAGITTHELTWNEGQIDFLSYYGTYSEDPNVEDIIASWTYDGNDVPLAGGENPRINFSLASGLPPADGEDQEFIIQDFQFIPNLTLDVDSYKIKLNSRLRDRDKISISGTLGKLYPAHLERADSIVLTIDSENLVDGPYVVEMPKGRRSVRGNAFRYRSRENDFDLDIASRQFTFDAKRADLTGLACPITLTIELTNTEDSTIANCYAETAFCGER